MYSRWDISSCRRTAFSHVDIHYNVHNLGDGNTTLYSDCCSSWKVFCRNCILVRKLVISFPGSYLFQINLNPYGRRVWGPTRPDAPLSHLNKTAPISQIIVFFLQSLNGDVLQPRSRAAAGAMLKLEAGKHFWFSDFRNGLNFSYEILLALSIRSDCISIGQPDFLRPS